MSEEATPNRLVLKEFRVKFEDRPGGDIVFPIDTQESLKTLESTPFTLKEGCHYKFRVSFKVQNDIVSGVIYTGATYRKGIRVAKDQQILGSFGPQDELHEITLPRHGWEEAPSGILNRGSYTGTSKLIDNENVELAVFRYAFDIKTDWGTSKPTQ